MAPIRGFTGWIGTILGTPDPPGLGRFYHGVLGGELDEGDPNFVTLLVRPEDTTNLAFQLEPEHVPPAWPTPGDGDQQMQVHLDLGVASVAEAVADATALGRVPAPGRRTGHARPGRPPVLPLSRPRLTSHPTSGSSRCRRDDLDVGCEERAAQLPE